MSRRVIGRWIMFGMAAVGIAALGSCGSSNKSTTPAPGGGGGTELNSGNIAGGGGSYSHAFMTAGSFPYHCAIHGSPMIGTVTVSSGPMTGDTLVTITGTLAYGSQAIQTGQTVRWKNNASLPHTVTSD